MTQMPFGPFSANVSPISFDAETHTFSDGNENYPSVTTVLADAGIINKTSYMPGSAQRGTDLHKLIQLYDENDLDFGSISDEQVQLLDHWNAIKERLQLTTPMHELVVWHPYHKYAGIVDIVDGDHLIEIKTGRKERWHKIQVEAYIQACNTVYGDRIRRATIVYTKMELDKCLYEVQPSGENFDVFLAALIISRWKNAKGKHQSGDPEQYE